MKNLRLEQVFKQIKEERYYQDHCNERMNAVAPYRDEDHTVSDWIIYIEHYLNKAKENIYMLDNEKAKEQIRKIAALAVACMEYNETKSRGYIKDCYKKGKCDTYHWERARCKKCCWFYDDENTTICNHVIYKR